MCVVPAVCLLCHSMGVVPCASVEAPWTPASLVPGSNPTARAARAKASNGWGSSPPPGVGGGGAHCCRWLGTFFYLVYSTILKLPGRVNVWSGFGDPVTACRLTPAPFGGTS